MAFSNFGINGSHFKPGKLSLSSDTGGSETVVLTSSAQGTVSLNASQLTASYAKIDQLDVNTINSVTTTETTLEVADALIIAGVSASSGVNGIQFGGGKDQSLSAELASVLYDGTNLDLNLAGTTYAALSTSKFEVQGIVSGSGQLQGASVAVDGAVTAGSSFIIGSADLNETDLEKLDGITNGTVAANKAVVVDASKNANGFLNIDGTGDLTMGTVTMTGFSVDADGDVVAKSLNNSSGGITNAGSIAGATSIDGTGDLTMGTITMTGFTVDADGDLTAKSIVIPDDATIGATGDTDMITLDAGADVTFANDLNVVIGKAGGLNLADGAVTSTAAELNLVDGSSAGSVVNSKAVIYSAAGQVAATSVSASSHYEIASFVDSTAMSVLKQEHSENGVTDLIALSSNGDIVLGGFGEFYNGVSSSMGFKINDASGGYEVILDNNGLQNISSMEGNSANDLEIKQTNNGRHMKFSFQQNTKDGESETGHIKFFEGQGEEIGSIQSGSINGGLMGKIIFGSGSFEHGINAGKVTVSAAGAVAGATSIDGSGDLTMGTITMTGFSVDADGDMVAKSLNNSNGGITNAGSIAGATTIDASGDLTVGTITNTEFTVDANGNTDIDGTLNVENAATLQSTLSAQSASFSTVYGSGAAHFASTLLVEGAATVEGAVSGAAGTFDALAGTSLALQSGGITAAGAIAGATSIDGTGDLTMGTITMTGFTVDADGDTALKSLKVDDGSTIGTDTTSDALTLAENGDTTLKSGLDFNIAGHNASDTGLKLGGTLVTSTAAELNLVDGSSAGSVVNSKAVIYSAGGEVAATTLAVGGGYGSTGLSVTAAGVLSLDGQLNHAANIIPAANGSQSIGSSDYRYNAVYANNVYTGDFHMKNERGDWTLFEESDHIRIRNNKTGQTFKLGMSLIEE